MRTVRMIVSGRVQGVFFRRYILEHAKELGIKGYVRNLPTGKVEIVAQGERIEELLRHAHRGPPLARVDEVKTEEIDEPETYDDFRIVH